MSKDYQSKRDLDTTMTPSEFILRDKIAFLKPSAINRIGFMTADKIIELLSSESRKAADEREREILEDLDNTIAYEEDINDIVRGWIASQRNQPSKTDRHGDS